MDLITEQLQESGYAVIPDVVGIDEIREIARFVDDHVSAGAGTRRLIERRWCGDLADRLARDTRRSGIFWPRVLSEAASEYKLESAAIGL